MQQHDRSIKVKAVFVGVPHARDCDTCEKCLQTELPQMTQAPALGATANTKVATCVMVPPHTFNSAACMS